MFVKKHEVYINYFRFNFVSVTINQIQRNLLWGFNR